MQQTEAVALIIEATKTIERAYSDLTLALGGVDQATLEDLALHCTDCGAQLAALASNAIMASRNRPLPGPKSSSLN